MKNGKLIVIEGMDGSGKTTQTELLVEWLRSELSADVLTLDFPGYNRSSFGKIIGAFLRGEYGDPVALDPFQSALLYAGDRMAAKQELCDALKRGATVVLNRYVPSNLAYGCAKLLLANRSQEREKLDIFTNQLEYDLIGLPRPDLVIVLDANEKVAAELIENKEERDYLALTSLTKDCYENNTTLQRLVGEQYQYFSLSAGWKLIRVCDDNKPRPIDDIQLDIRTTLRRCLGQEC